MHYSRHRLKASVAYVTMVTLALHAHWSVCKKLNRIISLQFSSVQTCRSVRALSQSVGHKCIEYVSDACVPVYGFHRSLLLDTQQ